MGDVTEILATIAGGDQAAAERLLDVVYEELRRLAAAKMARESPGHTLQTTALVHEAYLRLMKPARNERDTAGDRVEWESRGHFFAAAAEAMRRILIDNARHKATQKRGGGRSQVTIDYADLAIDAKSVDLIALDEALARLESHDTIKANVVKLRFFAGLTIAETAQALGTSEPTVKRHWLYSRAWLRRELT